MARETRKIVGILFSDLVGDEYATDPERNASIVDAGKTGNLIRSLTEQHDGEWSQEIGNAVVCTFSSAVAATQCALEIQQGIAGETEFRPRIGIHVGDLVFRTTDLGTEVFGDAVNVAARVQALCEHGGICITGRVYEELRSNQAFLDFEDLGNRSLKNVNTPTQVYRIDLPKEPVTLSEFTTARDRPRTRRSPVPTIVISTTVLLALMLGWLLVSSNMQIDDTVGIAQSTGTEEGAESEPDSAPVQEVSEDDLRAAEFAAVREKLLSLEGKSDFGTRVWTIPDPVEDDAVYHVGIRADCNCTALLFAIDGSADAISLLYPNRFQMDGSLQSGEVIRIPSSGEWILRAVGGEGIDTMTLIVVDGPLEFGVSLGEIWSATPEQPERVAELETLLATIEALEWDSASAPLQIIPKPVERATE